MRMARLELARQSHTPLKRACLPIPPHPRGRYGAQRDYKNRSFKIAQNGPFSMANLSRFGVLPERGCILKGISGPIASSAHTIALAHGGRGDGLLSQKAL